MAVELTKAQARQTHCQARMLTARAAFSVKLAIDGLTWLKMPSHITARLRRIRKELIAVQGELKDQEARQKALQKNPRLPERVFGPNAVPTEEEFNSSNRSAKGREAA